METENEYPIRRLILEFPNGESVKTCGKVIRDTADRFRSRISEGGMTIDYMPLTKEDEKYRGCEFSDYEMTYVYAYPRKGKKENT